VFLFSISSAFPHNCTSPTQFLGALLIFSTAFLAVSTLVKSRSIDAGLVGLVLSYALSTTQSLNWVIRSATEVETKCAPACFVLELEGL